MMLALFATLLTACSPPIPAANADPAIYAAVIRQVVTVDHSFGNSPPAWSTVYVLTSTDETTMPPSGGDTTSVPTLITTDTQQAIAGRLADLPSDIVWIASNEKAPISDPGGQVTQGKAVIVTLGNIHWQDDGSVLVSVWFYCGNVCGVGKTYILELIRGDWKVTGDTGVNVIS